MTAASKTGATLFALFLVLFIDGLGQGLIFPILTNVIINPNSHAILGMVSEQTRTIWYAVIICSFFVTWFFGAAILGDVSDLVGRKKALAFCLLGSALGYLISGLAFLIHGAWLLLLGRIIYGFTAGSQPIAQAAIVDMSPPEHISRNIGLVLLAVSLGIILGPVVGGFLADPRIVSWFTPATPLYFALLLSLVNLFYILYYFHETSKAKKTQAHIKLTRAIEVFVAAFKDKSVRYLALCFMVLQIGWSIYYLYMTVFLAKKYQLTAIDISIFFALLGVGLSLGFTVVVRLLGKLDPKYAVIIGYGGCLAGTLVTIIPQSQTYAWAAVIPLTALLGGGYPIIMTMFAKQVSAQRQGWVMGITGAIIASAAGLAIIAASLLSAFGIAIPLYFATLMLLAGCILISLFRPAISVEQ